ncbi:MAG: Rieske 2Fe-2S domain-containing protein [Alphaproteobacteria bacterium]|nr:Rieske 2Fe-2S domain-containing protein [Alphaproteobacteria bacterium]
MASIPNTVLCRLEDITDGEGKGFEIERDGKVLDIFVVRRGATVLGYHNVCPHVASPLNWANGSFMTLDRKYILCDTHGAEFRIEDGHCISGPCMGDRLTPLKVELRGDEVVLIEL